MATMCSSVFTLGAAKRKLIFSIQKFENLFLSSRYLQTLTTTRNEIINQSEYTDVAEYPEIFDASVQGMKRRNFLIDAMKIRDLPTVEQKLLELSRHKIFRAVLITPFPKSYLATLPFYQSITKTTLVRHLPEFYENEETDKIYKELETHFLEFMRLRVAKCKNVKSSELIQDFVFLLMRSLAVNRKHLINSTYDVKTRCDAFWWKGNFNTDNFYKNRKKDKMNVPFQFLDKPYLQIRTEKPLKQFISLEDPLCTEAEVPEVNVHPRFHNLHYQRRHATSTPGFWPGDPHEFPYMSIHKYNPESWFCKLKNHEEIDDFIMCHGIMSSFAWLMGIATNLGFTHFSGITYPLMTQTVVTDGQTWTFFAYQMNTISLHSYVHDHPLRNICWTSGQMKLYESIKDGEIVGLNPDVFKTLIKYFLNVPEMPEGIDLKPYVGKVQDRRYCAQKSKDKYDFYKFYSNRITQKDQMKEIPKWKWIYKFHPLAKPCPWQNN